MRSSLIDVTHFKGNLLFYYKDIKEGLEPLGFIILEGAVIANEDGRAGASPSKDSKEDKFCFNIGAYALQRLLGA